MQEVQEIRTAVHAHVENPCSRMTALGYLAQAQCLRQPKAFHEEIPVGFCEEPTSSCHQPPPSSQETGPRQNHCLVPPASLLPRQKAEICASRAVARAAQENYSYIQINN